MTDDTKKSDGAQLLPPREGLIPGTWKLMDPSRLGGVVDRPRLPARWTGRHVGMRLIEAHRVLARLPARIWPKQFGSAWPTFRQEAPPLIEQGSKSFVSERNRVQIGASADEIARMNEALGWPMQFLSDDAWAAADVNRWASQVTEEEFDKIDDGAAKVPWHGLAAIAAALNAAREIVR